MLQHPPLTPQPSRGVANEPRGSRTSYTPFDLSSQPFHSASSFVLSSILASVGGALTSDLPLPARLTDDSTPSHMQTRARLDTLPGRDIDVHVPRGTSRVRLGRARGNFGELIVAGVGFRWTVLCWGIGRGNFLLSSIGSRIRESGSVELIGWGSLRLGFQSMLGIIANCKMFPMSTDSQGSEQTERLIFPRFRTAATFRFSGRGSRVVNAKIRSFDDVAPFNAPFASENFA